MVKILPIVVVVIGFVVGLLVIIWGESANK